MLPGVEALALVLLAVAGGAFLFRGDGVAIAAMGWSFGVCERMVKGKEGAELACRRRVRGLARAVAGFEGWFLDYKDGRYIAGLSVFNLGRKGWVWGRLGGYEEA